VKVEKKTFSGSFTFAITETIKKENK